jgi:alpha-N-arabinofuranosidase
MLRVKKSFFLFFILLMSATGFCQQASMTLADNPSGTISKYIYGHFAEHLGRCIYDGFYRSGKIRTDIVDALKNIHVPVLRWPGGCYADQYHWSDGIGPQGSRLKTVNTTWGMVIDDNSFGTSEFLQLCELIGCQPYIAGNVGTGSPQEMQRWIEYLNFAGASSLAELRRTNGHAQPFQVRFWGVGNESWGCGGNMTPELYAGKYSQYAEFCKDYPGSRLFRIASGANGDDYRWTETLMKNIQPGAMQGLSLHYYTLVDGWDKRGSATDFSEDQYFKALKNALLMDSLIRKHSKIMDQYDPDKKVALVVDEWGIWTNVEPGTNPHFLFQQNSLRDALIAASTLNVFNNHSDRVRMANLAQTVNVLQALVLTKGDQMLLTPTYYVFDLFKSHQDAKLLPLAISCPYYKNGPDSVAAINASASLDSNNRVHITIVNLDPRSTIAVKIKLNGSHRKLVGGQILTSEKFTDINTFDKPGNIQIKKFNAIQSMGEELQVNMPSKSVVLIELQ